MAWRNDIVMDRPPRQAGTQRSDVLMDSQVQQRQASTQRSDVLMDNQPQQSQQQRPAYTAEQRRLDGLAAEREMLLAQAHKSRADSNLPSFKTSMVKLGAGVMSPIYRALGQEEKANRMIRFKGAAEEVQQEMEKGGIVPDWIKRGARNIGESLATAAVTAPAGAVGIIGAFTAQQADEAYVEGKDAGLKDAELAAYVTRQAGYEALPALVAQRLGLGGFEKIMGKGKSKVLKDAFKKAKKPFRQASIQSGKDIGAEVVEEVTTALLQASDSKGSGVNPDALSSENLQRLILDSTVGAVGGTSIASVPSLAAARRQGKYEEARAGVLKAAETGEEVSRKQWSRWGLPKEKGLSRATRQEGVKEIAGEIIAAEAKAEQEAASEQAQATHEPQQEPPAVEPDIQAGPAEATPPGPLPDETSIRDEFTAGQREKRGDEPFAEPTPKTFDQLLETANQTMAESPGEAGRLVERLLVQPEQISDEQVALLQVQYRKLINEDDAAANALYAAQRSGDKAAIKKAQANSNTILAEIRNAEKAYKRAGTEQGRSLGARRMAIKPDFSLGSVVRGLRVAKAGKELDAAEMAKAQRISEAALANEAKQEEVSQRTEDQRAEAGLDQAIKAVAEPKKRFKRRTTEEKTEARERVDAALADFKAKLAEKGGPKGPADFLAEESGALDLELVASGAELAKAYVGLGVSTFAEFLGNVQSFLGDGAGLTKDVLRAAWIQTQEAGLAPKPNVEPGDTKAIHKFASDTARKVVEAGVTDRDGVVDLVHMELQGIEPDITRREAIDAIIGHGMYAKPSKKNIVSTINKIKNELRAIAKAENKKQPTKDQAIAAKIKSLTRSIVQIEADLKSGDVGPKKRPKGATSPEIETLKKRLGKLRAERAEQRQLDKAPKDLEAEKTARYKRTLGKRITDLERRIAEGDFSKVERKATKLDAEAVNLKYKATELRGRLDSMEEKLRVKNLKGFKKLGHGFLEVSNLTRATKTSMDLSALLRQAKFAVLASYRNPKLIRDATFNMVKSFWSKELAFTISEELKNDPMTIVGDRAGLSTTEIGGKLTDNEEQFRGELSQYVPGVAGSERAYVVGLNTMRRGYFKALMESMEAGNAWRQGGKVTEAEAEAIANVVNVFTGRGQLQGKYLSATEFLSTYLFAPRFVTSRFQFALAQPMWGGNTRTRKIMAEQYAKSMTGMAAIYSLAAVGGMFALDDEEKPQFEWDPRASEYGKIRWGDIVLDPAAGVAQVITVLSRLVPSALGAFTDKIVGKTKAPTGEVVPITGPDVPWGGLTANDVLIRFLRSKLAPIPGAAWNAVTGKNIINEDTNAYQEMLDLPVPLSFGDVYDALQVEGYGMKATLAMLAMFGDGVNRYQNVTPERLGKKIALHPKLEGTSERTGKDYSYTQAVRQIAAKARKMGWTKDDMKRAVRIALSREGRTLKSIEGSMQRIDQRAR